MKKAILPIALSLATMLVVSCGNSTVEAEAVEATETVVETELDSTVVETTITEVEVSE